MGNLKSRLGRLKQRERRQVVRYLWVQAGLSQTEVDLLVRAYRLEQSLPQSVEIVPMSWMA